MDILFSHVSIVTMDERMSVWVDAFLGVTDGKIAYIGKTAPEEKPERAETPRSAEDEGVEEAAEETSQSAENAQEPET